MRYFLDTEFNEFGGEIISLAMVSEDGHELYVAAECPNPAPWVKENVMPIVALEGADPIPLRKEDFGKAIAWFLQRDAQPEIVADWPDDIKYFCQAIVTGPGQMIALHSLRFDLVRVDAYPTPLAGAIQHNALWDARALREAIMPQRRITPP